MTTETQAPQATQEQSASAMDETTTSQTDAQPQADAQALQAEIERLRKHNETLLSEKKSKAQQASEAEAQAKALAEEKAKRDGDYESLLEAREAEKAEALTKLQELEAKVEAEKVGSATNKLAASLAVDADAAELLSPFLKSRLGFVEGKVVVLDSEGEPSTMTLDELATEFKANKRYSLLVAGSGASGGGASKPDNGSANVTTKNTAKTVDLTTYLKSQLNGVM